MIPTRKEFFKLKVVIVMGYNGLEFHGMQKNAGVQTIEQAVEKALYDSELILDHNFDSLQKIKWSRAARTDKGVHAIANFVNCKLSITSKYLEDDEEKPEGEAPAENQEVAKGKDKNRIDWKKIIGTINSHLPSSVRVHTIKRITKAFDVKQSARSRLYEYLSPTSMFIKDASNITAEVEEKSLERLQTLCQKFKGTHNFHNYTTKMRASDPKAMRYIMDFQCELIDYKEKGRFYLFKIRGQSFIYHQIRKMIGIMVQVIHQDYKDNFIDNSFYQNSIAIWLAPPQGLFLDRVTFEAYNKKLDIPEKLEFNPEEEAQLQEFKENTIYPLIVDAEYKNKTFSTWLETTKVAEAQGRVMAMESADEEGEDDDGDQKGGKGKGKKNKNQRDQQKNKPAENKPEEPKNEEQKPEENKTEEKKDEAQ